MAKKLAGKKEAEKPVKSTKAKQEVQEEVPEVPEVPEAPVDDEITTDEFVMPVFPEDYAYEIKAGKGTFSKMSADDVLAFTASTLGKVDKIVITRM